MAAEDNKPRVFTRTRDRDGRALTRIATTPADVVAAQFAGWTEVTGAEATRVVAEEAKAAAAAEKAAAKTDTAAAKK